MAWTEAGLSPPSSNASTRRSARPSIAATLRSIEASMPAFVATAARRTATPRATPPIVSAVRSFRAVRLRQANADSRIRLEAELGEPGDERSRVVRLAPELDLLEDPAVPHEEHSVGV